MEHPSHKHTLTDFWKIPSNLINWDGLTKENNNRMAVIMPAVDDEMKPALYKWDNASLFASVPGFNSKSNDISAAIRVDPTTGTVLLPFNIDEAVINLLTEQYIKYESYQPLFLFTRQLYYKLKPLLPRSIQVRFRKMVVDRMWRRKFPAWDIDASVNFLHRNLLVKILETNPGTSLPMISFWPQGAKICLLLTHDVETLSGIGNIPRITTIEERLGFRSVWNFVPEKYPIDINILRELQASGYEIGVHGLYHDGRLFESYHLFQQRAAKINNYLSQWGSVGFRSESNLRNIEWISEQVQAEYDTSCLSTEWYGAQPGGCCTVFPFIHRGLVELPITLQQDFTLLDILNLTPEETLTHWLNTINTIKELNGLILINVHPDYMISDERLKLYANFLEAMKSETDCWHVLPKEAAHWWVDRNNSEITRSSVGWQIAGPASDRGVVMMVNLVNGKLCIQPV